MINKFTLEYLVTTTANIYIYVFLGVSILNILYSFTDDYKRTKEAQIQNGTYGNGSGATIIFFTLYILSIYYK